MLIIFLIVVIVYAFFVTKIAQIQYKKTMYYEGKFVEFSEMIRDSNEKLNEIDVRGSFSSDDEVGFAFKVISEIFKELNKFVNKE